MSNVLAWVAEVMEDERRDPVVKVTVRIDPEEARMLDELAERLALSRTSCATGLLTAALKEAHASVVALPNSLLKAGH